MQKKRKFFIMTASIGEGHSQAARAIAETIKQVHPDDAVRVLDFLSNELADTVDGLLKNEDKLKQMALACGNDKKDSALEIVQILDHMLESNTN